MFAAKNNEPFSACEGFSKMVSDLSPYIKLARKYGAGKIKTTQTMKGKSVFGSEETKCAQCVFEEIIFGWLFTILFLFLRLHSPVTRMRLRR